MKKSLVACVFWMASVLSPALLAAPAVNLPGLVQLTLRSDAGAGNEAWDFTYTETGFSTVSGIIIKPLGSGPFPAVVANHGKGGNAAGFGIDKGSSWFAPAGYLTIAPELTHAGSIYCKDATAACGGSIENVRRSRRAADILNSQNLINLLGTVVDRRNIFLYGNSLGATTTIELAEAMGAAVRAVAITAGGIIISQKDLAYMTPSGTAGVTNIYAPVIQMHGNTDNVIYPSDAKAFSDALIAAGKVHQMIWFPNAGHNISKGTQTTAQVRDFIVAWFDTYVKHTEPTINSLTPTAATVGSMVSVSGNNYGVNVGSNSVVTIGGVPVSAAYWSNNLIELTLPTGVSTGAVEVVVPVGPVTDPHVTQPVIGGVRSNRVNFRVMQSR